MAKRLALITGGTSGIGLGAARHLAGTCDLALGHAGNTDRARDALDLLRAQGAEAHAFAVPLGPRESARVLVDRVTAEFGRSPDVVVNAAGGIRDGFFMTTSFEDHEHLVREHLLSTMALCHLLIKPMYGNSFGRIVNVSSTSGFFANRGQASYAAAKGGMIAFTRTLALEVAHRGITVNAVAPGLIETPMTEPFVRRLREDPRAMRRTIPAGYPGTADDVGALIAYLCSDAARYITGAVMVIDGGLSLGDCSS